MLGREPAVIIATLAAMVQGAVIFVTQDPGVSIEWALPIITMIGGLFTRNKVMPTKKIEDAGLDPETINANARRRPTL